MQARQAVGHQVHRRLRRPPLARARGERVEPILRHVDVERAQIDGRERVQRLEDRRVVVRRRTPCSDRAAPAPRSARGCSGRPPPAAPASHLVDGRVEVVQVRRRRYAQRVADLPVRLDGAREDLLAEADLLRVVAHRHPQPQDVGAALLDDVLRLDRVAERLRHLPAVLVDDEAVRDDLLNGGRPRVPSADEQRALEPAAVLVAALEVDVGRPRQLGPHRAAPPRGSIRSRTRRRGCSSRARTPCRRTTGTRARRGGTPRSAARTTRRRRSCSNTAAAFSTSAGVSDRLAARRAVDRRDRHAPRALARDAPVGPVRDHVVDAVVAPRRDPLHVVVDRVERRLAQRRGPVPARAGAVHRG